MKKENNSELSSIITEKELLEQLEMVEEINIIILALSTFKIKKLNDSNLTYIPINESFDLVYKFLKENYPDKAYLYANVISRDDKIKLVSNKERDRIDNLVYERFLYYLKDNDLDKSLELLQKELENVDAAKNYFDYSLRKITSLINYLKENYKWLPKFRFKNLAIKKISLPQKEYYSKYDLKSGFIEIVDNHNVETIVDILHEYVHKDTFIFEIEDSESDELTMSTSLYYLSELPSITMELELVEWLYQNKYITNFDYKYVIDDRLEDSVLCADTLLNYHTYNKETREKIKLKENIDYTLSTALAITILKRNKEDPKYRTIFIEATDNIDKMGYDTFLEKLNLDYRKKEILEEIINNLLEYYHSYQKIDVKGNNPRRK